MTPQVIVALSTCPDEASAATIARTLVQERLAACVNRVGGVRSTFIWEGGLQDEEEILLIIKTTADRLAQLTSRCRLCIPMTCRSWSHLR